MNFESSPQDKTEKTQEELRKELEQRLYSLKAPLLQGRDEYEESLENGVFDGEEGEKKKLEMQKKLTVLLDRAEKMKAQLDSGEELPQYQTELSTTYTHPDNKQETIMLNLEQKLKEFLSFYKTTNIDLPLNFEDTIQDIWDRNISEIEQSIQEKGFDDMLLIPANIPLTELKDKMSMESGYYEGSNFTEGGSFAGAVSQNTDKPRIVLIHKTQNLKDRPELAQTLNIKGQDVDTTKVLTLEDYLIFQRKYFEENGKHLDEEGWTWLGTKSGARLVDSRWSPVNHWLDVHAFALGYQREDLGVRPSRSFI